MRFGKLAFFLLFALLVGCGYRLAARKGDVGSGRTFAVPTFVNNTNSPRLEQRISEALRQELTRSTHYKVTSAGSGDVVMKGEVIGYGPSPTVFDEQGRAAQYVVTLTLKILVTDQSTGKTLFQNDGMSFRDNFQLSQTPGDFVPEDPAALRRIAERVASAVVAALVNTPS